MTLLDELKKEETWQDFLAYKKERNQLSKTELKKLETFIMEKKYLRDLNDFSYPVKKQIAKRGSDKKRTVYSYTEDETWILKVLCFLLYKYDDRISDNCYSFRRNKSAKSAFEKITRINEIDQKYVLKLDIHDYFNSIDVELLIKEIAKIIDDDPELNDFLISLLRQDRCIENGKIIREKRGAMAGVPLSAFFADIYLKDLDEYFLEKEIPYFRYSDDMIFFFDDEEETDRYQKYIIDHLNEKKLILNEEKYQLSLPGEVFEFLGFSYKQGKIDLSEVTVNKMKQKIRRKANRLYRWRVNNKADYDRTAKAMIRSFDRKFYDLDGNNEFSWIRFYFPIINSTDGLQKIDEYMQEYLRYLYSGRHYKGNYHITYEHLKKLGYTPLKAEYYKWQKENRMLDKINQK